MNDNTTTPAPNSIPDQDDKAATDQQADVASEAQSTADSVGREAGQQDDEASAEELLLTLQDAQLKADEHWNQLLRVKADFDNYQRRTKRELENAHKFALEGFVRDLLPVIDSLEMGLAAAQEQVSETDKLHKGMDMTLKIFQGVLEKTGVKAINPDGEKFNPELHQAMTTQPSQDVEPNTVLTVYQKGYLLNDRLVRPAMVIVSASPGNQAQPDMDENKKSSTKIDEIA